MKKFEKIVTWIQEEVRSGRMVSGEKLPSEQELSEQFQVSRQTVRRALEELVKENIVESRRGSGSYICEDAGMLLGNTERRADHEEKRIAVMLTYIDTYIFPIIVREIEKKELLFIGLSGIATGASWLCYYRALQEGPASVVVPIDKLSILVTIAFSWIVFHEKLTQKAAVGVVLITLGTVIMTMV